MTLRLAGSSFDEIARIVHRSVTAVRAQYWGEIRRRGASDADVEALRYQELARLDRLQASRWARALRTPDENGVRPSWDEADKAFDRVLRVIALRADITGMRKPPEVGPPDQTLVLLSPEQVYAELVEIRRQRELAHGEEAQEIRELARPRIGLPPIVAVSREATTATNGHGPARNVDPVPSSEGRATPDG